MLIQILKVKEYFSVRYSVVLEFYPSYKFYCGQDFSVSKIGKGFSTLRSVTRSKLLKMTRILA